MILLIRRKWVLGAAALLLAVVSLLSLAERPRARKLLLLSEISKSWI